MKTPEEIKQGLECCSADECHGQHVGCPYVGKLYCVRNVCGDALAYIQQLERERDAAVEDLSLYAMCAACKHGENGNDVKCPVKDDCLYGTKGHFEWRGAKEE